MNSEQGNRMTFDFGAGPVPAHRHPNGGGWVADTAIVSETAYVGPEARVFGRAQVFGAAQIYGRARVFGEARVYDRARVFGAARVYDRARVFGHAQIYDRARVYGRARVYDRAQVLDRAEVFGTCSRTPLFLSGLEYLVTICDDLIQVGCQSGTLEEWRTKTPEKCPLLEAAREMLLALAEQHQAVRG